jgi:hypothetical protein
LGAGAPQRGAPAVGSTFVPGSTFEGHAAVTPSRFWSGSTFEGHAAVTPCGGKTFGRPRSLCRRLSSSCACFARRSRSCVASSASFFSRAFVASRSLASRSSALRSFRSGFAASGSSASFFVFFLRGPASLFGRGALVKIWRV